MSESLIDKIRKSRQGSVDVNGFTFYFVRPTDIQLARMYNDGDVDKYEVVKEFVTGWNLKESDIVASGDNKLAEFNTEIYCEWLEDARDYWSPIYEAIMTAYVEYSENRGESVKN